MKKYNIGLDIGTESVGWAVVEADTQKLMKKGNNKLWGVRLFESAKTAADRRSNRRNRRRYDRRRERIKLLQEEFEEEINKVDKTFFTKLKESFYREDDDKNRTIHLSLEEKRKIKEYHNQYKTIYHLRNALMTENKQFDIRLVYLAIHHIIKYRGNFLYDNNFTTITDLDLPQKIQELLDQIANDISSFEFNNDIDSLDLNYLANVLMTVSKNDRKVKMEEMLKENFPKSFISEFVKMLNGNKFNFGKMFNIEFYDEVELSFKTSDYDDNYDKYERILQEKIELLESLKQLYDMVFLKQLFKNSKNSTLSALMVEKYNQHQKDLQYLKSLFKCDRVLFNKFFKNNTKNELCIYERYLSDNISNDELIKEINKYLPDVLNKIDNQYLIDKYNQEIKFNIANGYFLPKITDKENGKYPYQLNREELNKIIEMQGKYYSFLLNKYDNKTYRITRLLEFRIPYYIGPLVSEKYSSFAWLERKEKHEKITPFNFDRVIDKEKTAEKFIRKMVSNCTYILQEKAMPTHSILYSKFKLLNELKQISVNGEKLSNDLLHKIYNNLFLKTDKVITDKMFKEFLYQLDDFKMYRGAIEVRGYSSDNRFANSMKSYYDFFGEEGIFSNTNYTVNDAENIIEWITIFNDKNILEQKVRSSYDLLSDLQVKKILSKNYTGWSRLSKKLLTEKYYVDNATNIKKSIMDLMDETNKNFMQILNDEQYQFQEMISKLNKIATVDILDYGIVEKLATSPATKRGIYQSLKVVSELVDYMGYDPESIILEMARSTDKKERKDDRQKYLLNLYKNLKNDLDNYQQLKNQLDNYEEYKKGKINLEKLFLYFIQEGKSLYSAKPLNIEDFDSYEVDHIIPQTLIKDDSIDNKALVLREENQIKAASYILPKEYRKDHMIKWWTHLKDKKLISEKKLKNLKRNQFNDEEIAGFINRQLVETRQIAKHVGNIFKTFYKKTNIIYIKANLSHSYREKYELYKFRDINNYHHAQDAYLAAVLGEYKEKYLKRKINFETLKELNTLFMEKKNFKAIKYGYVINSLDYSLNSLINKIVPNTFDEETGELLTKDFDAEKFNETVKNTLYCNDVLISRKTEVKTGEFYRQTKNKKGSKGVPLKANLPIDWYGSYTNLYPSYAVMVKYAKKKKIEKKLIGIPIYIVEKERREKGTKIKYIRNLLNLKDDSMLEIVSKEIPFYSLLNWDGKICYLVGASDKVEVWNAKEFHFDKKFMINYKNTLNKVFNHRKQEISDAEYSYNLNKIIKYVIEKIEKEYKLYQNLVSALKEMTNYEDMSVLTIENKEKIIIELMKLLKCDSQTANFKFLNSNYSSVFGRKNDRTISNVKIICKPTIGIKGRSYEL